jgi:hypothetical protein
MSFLKIFVGAREKKKKIDAVVSNFVKFLTTNQLVKTFFVDINVLDHNFIATLLAFRDLVV